MRSAGYIDSIEFLPSHSSGDSAAFADVTNGKIGLWTEEAKSLAAYKDYDMEIGATYFPVLEEGGVSHIGAPVTRVNQSKYAVSTTCSNPELAAEWLDIWYSSEATEVANWGVEGEAFEYDENGDPEFLDLITNNPDGISMSLARDLYTAPTGGYLIDGRKESIIWGDLEFNAVDIWSTDNDNSYNLSSYTTLTTEENAEYSEIVSDIITYVSTEIAKFITGERNIDTELDTFVQDIKGMNIERCVEIYQDAYDRYLQR